MALILCPECNKEISDKAVSCPNCGCPIAKNEHAQYEGEKLAEITHNSECSTSDTATAYAADTYDTKIHGNVASTENAIKSKIGIIIAVIAVAVLIIASILISNAINSAKERREAEEAAAAEEAAREQYVENLSKIRIDMLCAAADAEEIANLIHDVWYNTIYKEFDPATNKYTIQSSKYSESKSYYLDSAYNDDFNTSLNRLMGDTDIIEKVVSIKSQCENVTALYGQMQNPPSDLTACYSTLTDMYDAFLDLTGCATNPSGSLTTYTEILGAADSEFIDCYEKLGAMIPSPKEDQTDVE